MEPPRKPLGPSRLADATDEELDALSEITPQDVLEARAWAESTMPPATRAQLDADEEEGDDRI